MTADRSAAAAPRFTCPLCGGANGCAAAASGRLDTPCWCSDATFSAELLARVPQHERGAACVCAACAAASTPLLDETAR
jgi:hypothetical protein